MIYFNRKRKNNKKASETPRWVLCRRGKTWWLYLLCFYHENFFHDNFQSWNFFAHTETYFFKSNRKLLLAHEKKNQLKKSNQCFKRSLTLSHHPCLELFFSSMHMMDARGGWKFNFFNSTWVKLHLYADKLVWMKNILLSGLFSVWWNFH